MFWTSWYIIHTTAKWKENSEEKEQQQEKERANESDTNEFNDEDVEQEAPPDKTPLRRKIVTKAHEKRNVPRS